MFGFSSKTFLGIDFGTSAIKAVELGLKGKKIELLNYGEVSLSNLEKRAATDNRPYNEELSLYLRALLNRLQPRAHSAYVAMPSFIGLLSVIELPPMSDTELGEAIQFEAHKFIPSSLDDVALSWQMIGERELGPEKTKKVEVLAVAALKSEVERYRGYIEAAHLDLAFLELETFSLVRSLIGERPGLVLLIDIGARATNLVLVEDGIVRVSRNLDAGGNEITRTLMEALSITFERAEVLKKSTKDFLNTPEAGVNFPSLELVASEGKRMLDAYKERHPDVPCQEVVLSGGSAQFTGLLQYYEKTFGLPVRLGNPWEKISFDAKLEPAIKELGTSFSVALGLAMSGIGGGENRGSQKEEHKSGAESLKALLNKKI